LHYAVRKKGVGLLHGADWRKRVSMVLGRDSMAAAAGGMGMGVAIVVVPDRADVPQVCFEKQARRGENATAG
jgi:hypothetical protein